MLVRTWMSEDPVTISSHVRMKDAAALMREREVRHLPVVDDGKLVGMVTLADIRKASPSPATTFSVGEVNYLLDQIMVSDIMTPNPRTITPDTTVEDAALLGYRGGFGSLPVVEDGRLVGIITQKDLLDIMMSIFAGGEGDKRITMEDMPPTIGATGKIVEILDRHKTRFSSILVFPQRHGGLFTYLIRVRTTDVEPIVGDLKAAGFPVTLVS
jgi:acetoin utilization protein AcuB